MMKGVYFDNLHSFRDFGLILSNVEISPPQVKTKKIEIYGADGAIDVTEFDGNIYYYNRSITLTFSVKEAHKQWAFIYSDICNALHGKEMNIVFDDDSGYVWKGRVNVSAHSKTKSIGTIEVVIDAEPYKYTKTNSLWEVKWDDFNFSTGIMQSFNGIAVEGMQEVVVYGYRKNVVPVIIAAGTISVTHNGKTTALSQGRNKVLNVVIKEGKNTLTFTGNGTVSIEFTGGSL